MNPNSATLVLMMILLLYMQTQCLRINVLFYILFTVVPSNICVFLSCRPFVINTTFPTGLVGVEVTSVSISVENIVLTTKGLQERNTQMLDARIVGI